MHPSIDMINLKIKKLWPFHGGLKVPTRKQRTHNSPIRQASIPRILILPLSQHIGKPALPVVNVGDNVLKGQVIADLDGYMSAILHAPSSGKVLEIAKYSLPHPSGLTSDCIVIETDGNDKWIPLQGAPLSGPKSPNQLSAYEIRTYIENAGIVGQGGAVFPSAIKLDKAPGKKVHTIIINAAECEPYITCDDALMQERSEEILLGARLIQKALGASRCVIAMEDDIPDTYEKMLKATQHYCDSNIQLIQVPEKYPSGSEKQLIKLLTNLEVPFKKIPSDIGVVCINVGTASAIYRAVYLGEPLISRIITLTGDAVKKPGNIESLFGTPLSCLLNDAEVDNENLERLVIGGPMMGYTLTDTKLPLVKSINCLLAAAPGELNTMEPAMPCIRCTNCAVSCPMNLLPQQMYWYAKDRNLDKIIDYNIFDCIECGCCTYVCPSNIPLVEYFRYAKAEIRADQEDKKKSDIARQRHEFKDQRLALAKAKKAALSAKRKKMLAEKKKKSEMPETTHKASSKKSLDATIEEELDPIKAAMQRVKEKKERKLKENLKDNQSK
jgi:electron transport complex protein RnfC